MLNVRSLKNRDYELIKAVEEVIEKNYSTNDII